MMTSFQFNKCHKKNQRMPLMTNPVTITVSLKP
jgi:hypothetical protein